MKNASAPDSPNPAVTIPLQQQANKDVFNYALEASRANTQTPFGSMTWAKTPSFNEQGYNEALSKWENSADQFRNPGEYQAAKPTQDSFTNNNWTYTTQLSPEQQKLYEANTGSQLQQSALLDALTKRVGQATSSPVDFSNLPALTGSISPTDNGADTFLKGLADRSLGNNFSNEVADATYGQATRYLDPQFTQQQDQIRSQLAEQGFVPGTPGYDRAMTNFMDTRNRAYGQAKDAAITSGYGQANTQLGIQQAIANLLANRQQQTFNQAQQAGTFENQARNQALAELLQQRNYPLNELNALRSGTQVQQPQGQATYSTPNLANTDVLGAYQQNYQNQLGQYSANVGANNALLGDATSLLGMSMLPGSTNLFTGLGKLFGG